MALSGGWTALTFACTLLSSNARSTEYEPYSVGSGCQQDHQGKVHRVKQSLVRYRAAAGLLHLQRGTKTKNDSKHKYGVVKVIDIIRIASYLMTW